MISFIEMLKKCQPVWFAMIYDVVTVEMCLSLPSLLVTSDINTTDDQICLLPQY